MLVLSLAWNTVSAAQPSADAGASDGDVAEHIAQINDRLEKLGKREQSVDAAVRKRAERDYQQAIAKWQSVKRDRDRTAKLAQQARNGPDDMRAVRKDQHELEAAPSPADLQDESQQALSARADTISSRLADTQATLADLRDQLTRLAQRPAAARRELADARDALQSLDTKVAAPKAGRSELLVDAHKALNSARREALSAKIARLQQELNGLDAREQLLEARRALTQQRLARDNAALAAVQQVLGRQQNQSAKDVQQRSREKLSELRGAAAPVTAAAQHNLELSNRLATLVDKSDALAERQTRQRRRVEAIQQRLSLVQRQLEIGGGSVALGGVLRSQRRDLAKPSLLPSFDSTVDKPEVANVELQRFQLQQKYSDAGDPGARAREILSKAGVEAGPGQLASLTALLEQRRRIVERLMAAQARFIDVGRNLRTLSQEYNDTLVSFNRLLDERLFWLPSSGPITPDWPVRVAADLPWALDPAVWREALRRLVSGARAHPVITGLAVVLLTTLIGLRRAMRARLGRLAEPVGNVRRDHFWLTLRALVLTLLMALPAAGVLRLIGYLIAHAPDPISPSTQAVSVAFTGLSMLALFIEPFAQICCRNGLAHRHFLWSDTARHGLRRLLRWLFFLLIVPTVIIAFTEVVDNDAKRETIGRATFMFSSLVLAAFFWRLLHPARGVLANVLGETDSPRWRLGYLWLPLAVGVPLLLAGLAASGFYYTALQLQTRFVYSAGLLGGCRVLFSLIVRWLTIAERRLALTRALRKREEARQARASREAAAAAGEGAPDSLDTLEIDLVQISEQTRGLIKIIIAALIATGLWLIWSDTLPALTLLDGITLWRHAAVVDGQTQLTSVTLGALLLALGVGVMTWLAGRNLPGFLEITILRRFSLNSGSRYAMATLFQYAIVTAGLLVAVSLIGLRWSSIQWLVAAIGVGLGFGLQEIFANFVSGIVILFERPVRVGDTVTVGTLTGTVSRIRIRATTVTDWDNKEVLIPNKTFITETVINWTLTDDITRLVLRIGVSYDADGDQVEDLIMQAIKAEPVALGVPAPSVFVVEYGDSSVIYEARIFYHDLYNLLPLQHAVYRRIQQNFAAHGLRMIFPQHDLHLRSIDDSVASALRGPQGEKQPGADDATPQPQSNG